MTSGCERDVRVAWDLEDGSVLATVELPAPPGRVFHALLSAQICDWWVRPGVFDTRTFAGETVPGGHWRATGVGLGGPYALEGDVAEVEVPVRLVHTWRAVGAPGPASRLAYTVAATAQGSRLTLRHTGLGVPQPCTNTALGWQTSFERLADLLAAERLATAGAPNGG